MDVLAILAALSGGVLVGIGATIAFAKYGNLTTAIRNAEREVYEALGRERTALESQFMDEVRALHARLDEVDEKHQAEQTDLWREVHLLLDIKKEEMTAKSAKRKVAVKRKIKRTAPIPSVTPTV